MNLNEQVINNIYIHLNEKQKTILFNKLKLEKTKYQIYEREVVYGSDAIYSHSCSDRLIGTVNNLDDVHKYVLKNTLKFMTDNHNILSLKYDKYMSYVNTNTKGYWRLHIVDKNNGLASLICLKNDITKDLSVREIKYYMKIIAALYTKGNEYEICFRASGGEINTCFLGTNGGHWGYYWVKN